MSDPRRPRLVWSDGPVNAPTREQGAEIGALAPAAHRVRVRRERAGRGGKTVTVAMPFFLGREEAGALARELKRRAGSGGTLRRTADSEGRPCFSIEIQGDHADAVVRRLGELGYGAARGGG